MAYITKIDGNGYPIEQAIETLKKVEVPTNEVGEVSITVPKGAFALGVKRSDVNAEMKINEGDFVPFDEADSYSPFVEIKSLKIKINTVGANPIVLVFMV